VAIVKIIVIILKNTFYIEYCKNYILTQFSKQDDFLRFNGYFDNCHFIV